MKYLLLCLSLWANMAQAGWRETGNGGDRLAQDFAASGVEAVEILAKLEPKLVDAIVITQLRLALAQTEIYMHEHLCNWEEELNNWKCYEARNYPEVPQISVSRNAWLNMNYKDRLALALHEYLGIIGVEKNTYHISAPFKQALGKNLERRRENIAKEELASLENFDGNGISEEEARAFCEHETATYAEEYFYIVCEFDRKSASKPNGNVTLPTLKNYRFWGYHYSQEEGRYFYVFERIRYSMYDPQIVYIPVEEQTREEYSYIHQVRVLGIGPLATAPFKTILNSRKMGGRVALRFTDELQAWQSCFYSLQERMYTNWKFERAECEVAQENPEKNGLYYYLIRTQNPYVTESL